MDCVRCGRQNPDHIKYCLDCGSVVSKTTGEASRLRSPALEKAQAKLNLGRTRVVPAGAGVPIRSPIATTKSADSIDCKLCKAINPGTSRFCRECGTALPASADPNLKRPLSDFVPKREAPGRKKVLADTPAATQVKPEARLEDSIIAQPSQRSGRTTVVDPLSASKIRASPITTGGTLTSAKDEAKDATKQAKSKSQESKICQSCGATSGAFALFCQICGRELKATVSEAIVDVKKSLPISAALVVIAQDGSPGRRFKINESEVLIGKGEFAQVKLDKDPYVSPSHARLRCKNGRYTLEDLSSINGVFVRIRESMILNDNDRILFGLAVLKFEMIPDLDRNIVPRVIDGVRLFGTPPTPKFARLKMETVEEIPGDIYYLSRTDTVLGREVGEIVFTSDPFMSRRHAAIRRDPNTNQFTLRDLGSSNGTFLAISSAHELLNGDHMRIGQHLFRLDVQPSE